MTERTLCPNDHQTTPDGERELCRRQFFRTAGCFAMTLAVLGLGVPDVGALPVLSAAGAGDGDERRYQIPPEDSVNIDRDAQVIVVRSQGHMYVFALSCPHQNNAVKWVPGENRFQCTKHDSQYQPDGIHTVGRATRNLDRYLLRRDGNQIVINLRQWVRSDQDPAAWAAATIPV